MPDSIDIDIQSTPVRRLLRDSPAGLGRALRGTINDVTALLLRDLSTYPPQRTGSTYVRTGTLRRSWSRTPVTGSGLALRGEVGSNENIAPYNRSVQDLDMQTRAHARTGWPTVQGVSAAREATINDMFEARVRAELGE
jgi:hypothetical protein